jgi:cobalt/nickel transport system permease protein
MTLPVGFPVRLDAPLSRVDPRWKLAALVPLVAVVGIVQTPGPALAALAVAAPLALLARLPPRWLAARLGTLLLALTLFVVLLPFGDFGDAARWELGPLSLSPHGVERASVLVVKAVALLTVALAAAATAPADVHLKALQSLRVPAVIITVLALTGRYLSVLLGEFATIRIALRLRGYRQRPTPASLRTVGHVAGMLLVRASDRAERVGHALRCRGFAGRFHTLSVLRTRPLDVAFFAIAALVAVGLVAWDLGQR